MAQPVTTLLEPESLAGPCVSAVAWCDGGCREWDDESRHHSTGFDSFEVSRGLGSETVLNISAYRTDENGEVGTPMIAMLADYHTDEVILTPSGARQIAAALMNAADQADPLPLGELDIVATAAKIGDQVKVDGEWLTIYGVLVDQPSDNVQLSVTQSLHDMPDFEYRDENPEHFTLGDIVRVRRRLHGSTAIAFVEPIPGGTR